MFGICQLETALILTYNEEKVFFLLLPLAGTLKWTNYDPLQYLQPTEIFLWLEKMKEPYIIVKKELSCIWCMLLLHRVRCVCLYGNRDSHLK